MWIMSDAPARAEHESLKGYLESVLSPKQRDRVLLTNFNHWVFAQGALADTAITFSQMDSQVYLAFWASKTPMLDVAWTTSPRLAQLFRSPSREQGIQKNLQQEGIPAKNMVSPPIQHWKSSEAITIPSTLSRSNIRAMRYRGADLGRAILQVHPDYETPMTDDFLWPRKWVEQAAKSFAFVYDQTRELIERESITCLAVYNGRFLHDRAAAAAAMSAGIPILSYDLGGLESDFDLTIDETHDWDALQKRMLGMYESWEPQERDDLGSKWFTQRTQHLDPLNKRFVEAQEIGKSIDLPTSKKIIVYFSSSGDEIIELDLDWTAFFGGQENAVGLLAEECRKHPDYFLVIRSHPHKRMKPKDDVRKWMKAIEDIKPDIHIDPFADVDSYTLMRQADVVVTYGSTTGVEAAFARKPVIVMGPSAYDKLGCAVGVSNASELAEALIAPKLGNWQGAVSFGLMMMRRGFSYNNIKRNSQDELFINGSCVKESGKIVKDLSNIQRRLHFKRLRFGKWGISE
jgi:hypothetical protein